MPCEYDTFSEVAYPTYMGGTSEERSKRDFLIQVMKKQGFKVHSNEWWHYDHKLCNQYKILNIHIPFKVIGSEDLSKNDKSERR